MPATTTRTRRRNGQPTPPPAAAGTTTCRCPSGHGVPVARFVAEQLVDVERRHLRAAGCHQPTEHVEPRAYLSR